MGFRLRRKGRALRRRYGRALKDSDILVEKEDSKEYGYRLGLGDRQKHTEYNWGGVQKIRAREKDSGNALRLDLYVFAWGPDGKRLEVMPDTRPGTPQHGATKHFEPGDVRGAIAYAKSLVKSELANSAAVEGEATRLFAMKGYGDRAVFRIAEVRRKDA